MRCYVCHHDIEIGTCLICRFPFISYTDDTVELQEKEFQRAATYRKNLLSRLSLSVPIYKYGMQDGIVQLENEKQYDFGYADSFFDSEKWLDEKLLAWGEDGVNFEFKANLFDKTFGVPVNIPGAVKNNVNLGVKINEDWILSVLFRDDNDVYTAKEIDVFAFL